MTDSEPQTDADDWLKIALGFAVFVIGSYALNIGISFGIVVLLFGIFTICLGVYGLRNAEALQQKGLKR